MIDLFASKKKKKKSYFINYPNHQLSVTRKPLLQAMVH